MGIERKGKGMDGWIGSRVGGGWMSRWVDRSVGRKVVDKWTYDYRHF